MSEISIVGVSGSLSKPSRTSALVSAVLEGISIKSGLPATLLELSDSAAELFAARSSASASPPARKFLEQVEQADLLVIGTPVYRASYTGALKHLFDLVDHRSFSGKPIVLTATGGSLLHALVIEHQLRPLFGFLNALTLPTSVYAVEADFSSYSLVRPEIHERIERIASEVILHLPRTAASRRTEAKAVTV